MFTKDRILLLRSTASAVSYNLDICVHEGEPRATVIHKSTVSIISWNSADGKQACQQLQNKGPSGFKGIPTQVKWCTVNQSLVLLVLSNCGLRVYNPSNGEMLNWYHLDANESCGQCLAVLKENRIAIGDNIGRILIFHMGPRTSDVTLTDTIRTEHQGSVTVVTSSSKYIASGGEDGYLHICHPIPPFKKVQSFETHGFPCTGIALWNDWVLAAYGSGHLRLFDISAGQIRCEVTAHARWISALDATDSGLVLSVSEDSFLRVWQLSQSQDNLITLKFSECVPDTQLIGGRFMDQDGTKFAVSGYESEELICYAMNLASNS